jgi:WD40 repeat protein
MVKISGTLLAGAVLVVFLGTALGFVGTRSLFPADERPEQAPALFAQSIILGRHQHMVRCLAFAPDGKTLATAGGFSDVPGEIKLWDLAAGKEGATLRGNQNGVYAVEFSPDGRTLAAVSVNQVVTLWDVATDRALASMPVSLPRSLGIVLAPDGLTLAVARLSEDSNGVRLWRVAAEKEHPLVGGSGPVRFSADGRRLALWRLSTEGESTGANLAYGQGFVPNGTFGVLPAAQIWDIPLGRETLTLRGHESFVWALAFSPDGRTLASGGFDETIKLWDVTSGREQATPRPHGPGRCLGICAGRRVARLGKL